MKSFDVEIYDQPFDPDSNDKIVYYFQRGEQYLYKVYIYLIGRDLPFVKKVTYKLHPTFSNPERVVARTDANRNCKLVTWAWGKFELSAIVEDSKSNKYLLSRYLQYDRYFDEDIFKSEGLQLVKSR